MRCGNCCRWSGWVFVDGVEADAIAAHLGIAPREFADRYTRLAPDRRRLGLTERSDGACVFLDGAGRCSIQAVKPRQCRDFPIGWNVEEFKSLCQAQSR